MPWLDTSAQNNAGPVGGTGRVAESKWLKPKTRSLMEKETRWIKYTEQLNQGWTNFFIQGLHRIFKFDTRAGSVTDDQMI